MPTCAVLGCTSGYRSNPEKNHLFRVPRNAENQRLWKRAIKPSGLEIRTEQSVCEKHFRADEILWQRKLIGPDGAVVGISPYRVPRLKKDAVPSIFPWSELLLSQIDELADDALKKVEAVDRGVTRSEDFQMVSVPKDFETCILSSVRNGNSTASILSKSVTGDALLDNDASGNSTVSMLPKSGTVDSVSDNDAAENSTASILPKSVTLDALSDNVYSENPTTSVLPKSVTLDDLSDNVGTENSTASILPLTLRELAASEISMIPGWKKETMICGETIFVHFFNMKCVKIGHNLKTYVLKEIMVKADMTFQISVLGQPLGANELDFDLSPICTIQRLQDLLFMVNSLNICIGTKDPDDQGIDKTLCRDSSGAWRHVRCCLLLSTTLVCPFCRRARKTVTARLRRVQKSSAKNKRLKLSPKKKRVFAKLRKNFILAERAKKRAQTSLAKLKSELHECQQKMLLHSESSLNDYLESTKLPQNQKHAVREIVAAAKCEDSNGRRYSEEWVLLCMLLHMRSPSGYNFLRNNAILPLPCVRTIRRYLSNIDTACGFDPRFFEVLKLALAKKEDIQRHGILLVDEIATRESVHVDTKTLSFKGLIDFGTDGEQSSEFTDKANHGLVIMFHPLADEYTQPIAVFASRGPVKGDVLAQLIVKAIILLENAGAKIHGVVTDGASTNRKFWSEMGVSGQRQKLRNYFEHPTDEARRVFVFSDTPHLIKTIRNRLHGSKTLQLDPTEPLIKWDDIEVLYNKDKELAGSGGIRMCRKLTPNHLVLNNSLKMRVRLAVQVFSNTVACGLRFYRNYVPELKDCEGTASFCEWINEMFDALNRKLPVNGLQPGNADYKILEESIRKLDSWEKNVEDGVLSKNLFLTPQTAEGLRVTLHSVLDLTTYLTKHCQFPYVLTGRINQDPLEKYFGTVRQAGGCNDHPSSHTFLQIHKILSTYSVLKPPKTGNCSISEDKPHQPLVTLAELKTIYNNPEKSNLTRSIKERLAEAARHDNWDLQDIIEHDYSRPEITNCVLYYVTANLARRISNTVKCVICKESLLSNDNRANLPESTLNDSLARGALTHPNTHLYRFVIYLEQRFAVHCNSAQVFECILDDVYKYERLSFPCPHHPGDLLFHVIQYYVTMRMQQYCSRINGEQEKTNQYKKKASKFCKT